MANIKTGLIQVALKGDAKDSLGIRPKTGICRRDFLDGQDIETARVLWREYKRRRRSET